MGIFRRQRRKPTPQDLYRAYCDGLPGAPPDLAVGDRLLQSGTVLPGSGPATTPIAGLHKQRPRVLLYKALRELDGPTAKGPGALADESQDTGDCASMGGRNCVDGSRANEIVYGGEPDQWIARSATEYIYAGRGHSGAGMSPQRVTSILSEGQLLRLDYREQGGPDLRVYNAQIGMSQGRSGIPGPWRQIAQKQLAAKKFIAAGSVEEALDCMAAGFCGHAGSQFGSSPSVGPDGLNRKTTSWNHSMGHFGYDITGEIWREQVVFIPNSWGAWNKPNPVWMAHQDVLGPWIPGMLVVPMEDFARHIIAARSAYYLGIIEGDAIKPLPLKSSGISQWNTAA